MQPTTKRPGRPTKAAEPGQRVSLGLKVTAETKRKIDDAREAIKLLNAEWSSLTRPERIQKLAEQSLNLQPTKAQQFVSVEDLLTKVPETVPVKLEEDGKDPIGDILKQMQ